MINRALVSAVIILAVLVILLAAALVKAIADKRIWKETAADCDKEITEVFAKCKKLEESLEETLNDRDSIKRSLNTVRAELLSKNDRIDFDRIRVEELEKRTVEYVFSGWKFIKPAAGCRDYYIENEGIRIIVEDGKATSGWYAKKFIKEGDSEPCMGTCENVAPLTNFYYISAMTVEEMAEFFENFDEEIAKTCKYCALRSSGGWCAPAPEGEDKQAYCKAATLKWLMDTRASEEKPEKGTEEDAENVSIEN